MRESKFTKQSWCIWVDEVRRIVSLSEIPNAKKLVFKNEQEGVDFAARLVFKGYKIG
ncbi:MAG: hypothetical protein J6D26_04185 [Clostridia bacterium]|nr:hypothetical protein [Clostridia bacterium]